MESCETCWFSYFGKNNDLEFGRCRYNPPTVYVNYESFNEGYFPDSAFPMICREDWCGKYDPKIDGELA